MNVAILHALEDKPELFRSFLGSVDAPFTYHLYDVTRGELPVGPETHDAYIVSGSPKGVYDDIPWIASLSDFVRHSYKAGKKMVGICFGHQLLAHVLGGYAAKSEKGWGVGRRQFRVIAPKPWMTPPLKYCTLYFTHQDQVMSLPPGAEVLAGDDFCPITIFALKNQVLGIQGHPEFSREFLESIIEQYQDRFGPDLTRAGRQSLTTGPVDNQIVAHWVTAFLQSG
jgi:GMP synthase-like glutamine amidotransferase